MQSAFTKEIKRIQVIWRALLFACVVPASLQSLVGQTASQGPTVILKRDYRDDEEIAYRMKALNEEHVRTIRYEAQASARLRREPSGSFIEEFAWNNLVANGQSVTLTSASQQFREELSLSSGYALSVPDLSKVQPILIGPVTDLLTFYADVQLAMRQQHLLRAGDHVYVKYGTPNSWADVTYTIFGQDSIDFDIELSKVDGATQEATLIVRHLPPPQSHIPLPAKWMLEPVGELPNSWAEVGVETFDVTIKLSLPLEELFRRRWTTPLRYLKEIATIVLC